MGLKQTSGLVAVILGAIALVIFLGSRGNSTVPLPTAVVDPPVGSTENNTPEAVQRPSVGEIDAAEFRSESLEADSPVIETWAGDSVFRTIDPALVDDSSLSRYIEGAPLNRYRLVEVNGNAIRELIQRSGPNGDISLRLFEDLTIRGVAYGEKAYNARQKEGKEIWRGTINGDGSSTMFVIAGPGDKVSITVHGVEANVKVSRIQGSHFHIIRDFYPSNINYHGDTK